MIYGNCNAACVEPHLNTVLCLQGTIITPATFLLFYFCFEDRNSKQITYSHDILLHAFTLYAKLGRLRKGQPLICRLPPLVLPHIRYCNMAAQRLRSKKPVVHETRLIALHLKDQVYTIYYRGKKRYIIVLNLSFVLLHRVSSQPASAADAGELRMKQRYARLQCDSTMMY